MIEFGDKDSSRNDTEERDSGKDSMGCDEWMIFLQCSEAIAHALILSIWDPLGLWS